MDAEKKMQIIESRLLDRFGPRVPDTDAGRRAFRLVADHLVAGDKGRERCIQFAIARADFEIPVIMAIIKAAEADRRQWGVDEIEEELSPPAAIDPGADVAASGRGKHRTKKQFLKDGVVPPAAMTWADPKEKGRLLWEWLRIVFAAFPGEGRVAKIAAILQNLFNFDQRRGGYAFVTNAALSDLASVPVGAVEAAMTKLAEAGFIIRTHTFTRKGEPERRTWPAIPASAEPHKVRGWDNDGQPPEMRGSTNANEPHETTGATTPQKGRKRPPEMRGEISE